MNRCTESNSSNFLLGQAEILSIVLDVYPDKAGMILRPESPDFSGLSLLPDFIFTLYAKKILTRFLLTNYNQFGFLPNNPGQTSDRDCCLFPGLLLLTEPL